MARAGFFRHLLKRDGAGGAVETPAVELSPIEAVQLSTVFAAPRWLRDLGRTSWLLVGLFVLLAGVIWLLGTTQTIVGPVVAATIVAAVTAPVVRRLTEHRIPRAAAAAIILLAVAAIAVLVLVIVIGGITSQASEIGKEASKAADKAEGWLQSVGVNQSGAMGAEDAVKRDVP